MLSELFGWVHRVEDKTFVLRCDGALQAVECRTSEAERVLAQLRNEAVVAVRGEWDQKGGRLLADEISLLNSVSRLPFQPSTRLAASTATRARYRYMEFRDPEIRAILTKRHRFTQSAQTFLADAGFVNVETPLLATAAGSGAREFQVRGSATPDVPYCLPQSAQVYAQLAVIGGIERYYQIARCFRDEDLRHNRQPEFTQIHIEAAFWNVNKTIEFVELLLLKAFSGLGLQIRLPFNNLRHEQALSLCGTDKPDARHVIVPKILPWRLYGASGAEDESVCITPVPSQLLGTEHFQTVMDLAQRHGFELLGFVSPKNLTRALSSRVSTTELCNAFSVQPVAREGEDPLWSGSMLYLDKFCRQLYEYSCTHLSLPKCSDKSFIWVTEFPLFKQDIDHPGRLQSPNNPFTAPIDLDLFMRSRRNGDLLKLRSTAFDLIMDGEEVASGSTVIHDSSVFRHVLEVLGISQKNARRDFGFLLDAMDFGAPPMTGIGIGLDRLLSLFLTNGQIRDVIAFPKTKRGHCPVTWKSFATEDLNSSAEVAKLVKRSGL